MPIYCIPYLDSDTRYLCYYKFVNSRCLVCIIPLRRHFDGPCIMWKEKHNKKFIFGISYLILDLRLTKEWKVDLANFGNGDPDLCVKGDVIKLSGKVQKSVFTKTENIWIISTVFLFIYIQSIIEIILNI